MLKMARAWPRELMRPDSASPQDNCGIALAENLRLRFRNGGLVVTEDLHAEFLAMESLFRNSVSASVPGTQKYVLDETNFERLRELRRETDVLPAAHAAFRQCLSKRVSVAAADTLGSNCGDSSAGSAGHRQ